MKQFVRTGTIVAALCMIAGAAFAYPTKNPRYTWNDLCPGTLTMEGCVTCCEIYTETPASQQTCITGSECHGKN